MTIPASNGMPPKVVGLGAPISAWIYFELIEIPALTAALADEIARYGNQSAANSGWADYADELRRMLVDVELANASRVGGRFDVVWPTMLAHAIVRGAVGHARRLLTGAAPGDLTSARAALAAAERTSADFDVVARGGRDAVWL